MEGTWEKMLIRDAEGNSTETQQEQQLEEPEAGLQGKKNRFKRKGIGEWAECLSRKAKKKAKLGKGKEKTAKYRKGVLCERLVAGPLQLIPNSLRHLNNIWTHFTIDTGLADNPTVTSILETKFRPQPGSLVG